MIPGKVVITVGDVSIQFEGPPEFIEERLSNPEVTTRFVGSITTDKSSVPVEKVGLDHSWQWFSLHAGQRMQGVNFFLVAVTFLSAAFVGAMQNHDKRMAVAIGVFGVFITVCFSRLELRVRELIHAGEAAMKPLQVKLAQDSGVPELRILEKVEHPATCLTKYSHVIRLLHWIAGISFLLAAIYSYLNI